MKLGEFKDEIAAVEDKMAWRYALGLQEYIIFFLPSESIILSLLIPLHPSPTSLCLPHDSLPPSCQKDAYVDKL
jgi:hypothetical protein